MGAQASLAKANTAVYSVRSVLPLGTMAEEEGQEVIFTENTAPDREIWDEKGGLIKKGAAEIAERDQDHVPEVKVLTTLGMFAVPVTAETTIGEIRQKVQEWKPEYSLEQ